VVSRRGQVHRGYAPDPVRQAPQHVPRAADRRTDVDRLGRHLVADRARRQLHGATVRVADAVHVLQRRLHHLLVDGLVLRAVRRHAAALLEDLPRHQRPRPPNATPQRSRVVTVLRRRRRRHRDVFRRGSPRHSVVFARWRRRRKNGRLAKFLLVPTCAVLLSSFNQCTRSAVCVVTVRRRRHWSRSSGDDDDELAKSTDHWPANIRHRCLQQVIYRFMYSLRFFIKCRLGLHANRQEQQG